jgi:catechol 2,3-dioxygenase-like lactoylglutathione lyase family enzyme
MKSRSGRGWLFAALSLVALAGAVASSPVGAADNPLGLKPHHVTASVIDIDRAVKWYQDALGFKLVERGTRGDDGTFKFAELEIPGFGVGLVQTSLPAINVPPGSRVRPSWEHVVFSVPDPDAAYRLLKKRGFDVFVRGPSDAGPFRSHR